MTTTSTDRPAHDASGPLAVLDALTRAWNAGDGEAYGASFSDDATYVTYAGDVLRGATEIAAVHAHLFAGPLRGTRLEGTRDNTEVRFPHPDVAVVLGGGAPGHPSVQTFVLARDGAGWRVTAFQNVRRAG